MLGTLAFVEGGTPAEWVARPRFHHQYLPDVVQLEPDALSPEVRSALRARGHRLEQQTRPWGNMQALVWDRQGGRVEAASDPRGVGAALVWRPAAQAAADRP